jgi:orotate phosphoribosyltransferase
VSEELLAELIERLGEVGVKVTRGHFVRRDGSRSNFYIDVSHASLVDAERAYQARVDDGDAPIIGGCW